MGIGHACPGGSAAGKREGPFIPAGGRRVDAFGTTVPSCRPPPDAPPLSCIWQVYNREPENEAEDFMLSAYDATVSLSPASAAALLADAPPPSLRGGTISGGHPATPTASAGELSFTARYLPMGAMPAVEEAAVAAGRLRLPPPGSAPFAVYADSGYAAGI